METVITVLMLLIALTFILKQSFGKPATVLTAALVLALFTGLVQPFAIEQSKTQISGWIANSALMLDVAVVMSVEIILHIAYCIMAANMASEGDVPKWKVLVYKALRWFPGVLILPVLFSLLTFCIFTFTGVDFSLISWGLAGIVLMVIPLGALAARKLIPEKELRLELLFIFNILTAIFGIVATVNGRTAVDGISDVNLAAFAGVLGLVFGGALLGWLISLLYNKLKNFN